MWCRSLRPHWARELLYGDKSVECVMGVPAYLREAGGKGLLGIAMTRGATCQTPSVMGVVWVSRVMTMQDYAEEFPREHVALSEQERSYRSVPVRSRAGAVDSQPPFVTIMFYWAPYTRCSLVWIYTSYRPLPNHRPLPSYPKEWLSHAYAKNWSTSKTTSSSPDSDPAVSPTRESRGTLESPS